MNNTYQALDQWINSHFDEEVAFLRELVRVPTDTPPGNNAPHAERTAELLAGLDYTAEKHAVPESEVRAAAAPSAPEWQQRWERAVTAQGLPVFRMPSGAGHDAMKLHEVMPQAMLFVRGENSGISHNPLESTTSDDMQLAVQAFSHLLEQLANDTP